VKQLIIMQGIPGAGKDTVLARDYPTAEVYGADDYFREKDPEYDNGGSGFNAQELGAAHALCFRQVDEAMAVGVGVVAVSNTNLENEAIAPYVALAGLHGYDVKIVRVPCDPAVAAGRCRHGVPEDRFPALAEAFDNWKIWPPHHFGGVKVVTCE
jgi:predicted kinase